MTRPIERIRKDIFRCTQAEMAAISGVTQASISRWESGSLEPDLEDLRRIRAEALSRGIEWDDRWFFDPSPPVHEGEAA